MVKKKSRQLKKDLCKKYDLPCPPKTYNELDDFAYIIQEGERVENPEFGTIIYDTLFEPLTEDTKEAILEDITENLNADPRIATEEILLTEADKGIAIQATIRYIPLDITEKLRFAFDENTLANLT